MSKELDIFKSGALSKSGVMDKYKDLMNNLDSGGGGGIRRISVKGGRFRKFVSGEQVEVSKDSEMNIVIVAAAPLSRTYYEGTYDPEKAVAPTCWSNDTKVPAKNVDEEDRQASRCMDCPQNIKGSGQGQSRACRYNQRLAVCIEGDYSTVYQLQLAATSIFGDAEGGRMPMGAYARLLKEKGAPAFAVVTEMSFDENAEVPKLFFKPVRAVTDAEFEEIEKQLDSDAAKRCVEMTVAEADNVTAKAEKTTKKAEEPEESEESEESEEPKKAKSKTKPKPKPDEDDDLAAMIDDWDDEDEDED